MKEKVEFENVLVHVVEYQEERGGEWKRGIRVGEDGEAILNIDGKTIPDEIYDMHIIYSDGCFVLQRPITPESSDLSKFHEEQMYKNWESKIKFLTDYIEFYSVEEGEKKLAIAQKHRNELIGNTVYSEVMDNDIQIIKDKLYYLKTKEMQQKS